MSNIFILVGGDIDTNHKNSYYIIFLNTIDNKTPSPLFSFSIIIFIITLRMAFSPLSHSFLFFSFFMYKIKNSVKHIYR